MGPFNPPHMPAQSIAGSSVESSAEALWTEPFPNQVPVHVLHAYHAHATAHDICIDAC